MLIAIGVALAVALGLAIYLWLWPRIIEPHVHVSRISPPRTRPLGPDEQAAGEAVIARARELIAAARDKGDPDWQGFRNEDFPHAEVRAERDAPGCFQVVFSRRLIFVPPGTSRVRSFDVRLGPKGLGGSRSASLESNESAEPEDDGWDSGYAPLNAADREAIAFVDTCFRTGGDFGVYGNVTCGIEPLLESCRVAIKPREQDFDISVDPIDGHGHFLRFTVHADGRVGQPLAGHYDPMPEEFEDE